MVAKLVLSSDQIAGLSDKVDMALLDLIGKANPKLAYIPSCSDQERKYFGQKVHHYGRYGITKLQYFDLDKEYDATKIKDILSFDAIHLSGGNTFYFLYLLRKRNLLQLLREYVYHGGVLIGVSAGAILMAKTIAAATLCDENIIGLQELDALGLLDFDFFPHWNTDDNYLNVVKEYSRRIHGISYICTDADGIIVKGKELDLVGNPIKIIDGEISVMY